ncbi:MAG: NAD(P)H-hydrate dehydratase [Candidatus Nitrosothermus koennekii]|nr:MAG: NAD(P)H-hydrate dehydratase [Candidatus Nitrosothermus koennekii]
MIADEELLKLLPPRSKKSKKGDNGIVLVVGGSRLYHGAPLLASLAAYRTGVDLVYLAVPRSISIPIRAYNPSIIVLPLPDDKLTVGSVNRLLSMLPKRIDAAAIGMGLSARKDGLLKLIKELDAKLVLDASALISDILSVAKGNILTPHAGEFKRLFNIELTDDEESRVEAVKSYAYKYNLTILLKAYTDIISDGNRVGLNNTHNCAMTVGGSGDVLAGITAALLAKGLDEFDAALLAAFINGSAGNLAYKRLGLHIMPTDIIDSIAYVMKDYESID